MSYEFKRLGEVNALGEMKEGLNVLAVDGSEVAKIAADEIINASIDKIVNAEVIEEASETATVLVEDNGTMKKIPAASIGGGDCKVIITCDCDYDGNFNNLQANVTYSEFEALYNKGLRPYDIMAETQFPDGTNSREICGIIGGGSGYYYIQTWHLNMSFSEDDGLIFDDGGK